MKSFIKDKWPLLIGIVALASFAFAAGFERIPKDVLLLGSGNSTDKEIRFDNGSSNPPAIKWNNTSNSLQFATDGQNFSDLGSGSGSTINYVINSNAEASPTTDLTATNMVVAGTSSTGLISGKQSFQVTPSASPNANVSWDLSPIPDRWNGKPFAVRATVDFTSVESGVVYSIGIHDGTNFVDSFEVLSPGSYDVHRFVQYDSASTYTFRVEATIGTPSVSDVFYIDDLYFGPGNQVAGQSIADKVFVKYGKDSGALPNSVTVGIDYDLLISDDGGHVETGADWKFTAPRQGKYLIEATLMLDSTTSFTIGETFQLSIQVNGATDSIGYYNNFLGDGNLSSGVLPQSRQSKTIQLSAGDEVKILGFQNSGGGRPIFPDVLYSSVSITELTNHNETTYGVTPTIEYAYNTAVPTAAGAIVDSISTAYGPEGVIIGNVAGTVSSSTTRMRVKFSRPILDTDIVDMQFKASFSEPWLNAGDQIAISFPLDYHGSAQYGAGFYFVTDSDDEVEIYFGNRGRIPSGGSFAAVGASWAGVQDWRWRLRKMSQGHVGVPLASDLNSGFIAQGERSDKAGLKSRVFGDSVAPTVSAANAALVDIPGCEANLPESGKYKIDFGFQGQFTFSSSPTFSQMVSFLTKDDDTNIKGYGSIMNRYSASVYVGTISYSLIYEPEENFNDLNIKVRASITTSGGAASGRSMANCFLLATPIAQ